MRAGCIANFDCRRLGCQLTVRSKSPGLQASGTSASKACTAEDAEYAEETRGKRLRAANRDSPKWLCRAPVPLYFEILFTPARA